MSLYDSFLDSIKGMGSKLKNDPATMDNVSGALAAEITVLVSLLLSALLMSHVNMFASVFLVVLLAVLLISNMPLAPKIKREQGDSLEKMSFYIIVTLGVLVAVIYWGLKYV